MAQEFSGTKLLVTGGAGFIGSNFIRNLLMNTKDFSVINLDLLTYAGNLENLKDLLPKYENRYSFVKGDIRDANLVEKLVKDVDAVVHFAAESHVDRSILNGLEFLDTNVKGTFTLLDAVRKSGKKIRFVHVSTDEVYGALGDTGFFTEETPMAPNSPYSASKASSDLFVRSFVHTHGLDAVTTRCSNNYGPYHFPEKLIPLMVTNALEDQTLPVYGKGLNVRDWIYVEDHAKGVLAALLKGRTGEVYNLGGESERKNIEVARSILKILKKPESLLRYVEDRKGHDFRYAIDCSKAKKELGWAPTVNFEQGLEQTVQWYVENKDWWKNVKTGAYLEFYKKYYGDKIK